MLLRTFLDATSQISEQYHQITKLNPEQHQTNSPQISPYHFVPAFCSILASSMGQKLCSNFVRSSNLIPSQSSPISSCITFTIRNEAHYSCNESEFSAFVFSHLWIFSLNYYQHLANDNGHYEALSPPLFPFELGGGMQMDEASDSPALVLVNSSDKVTSTNFILCFH